MASGIIADYFVIEDVNAAGGSIYTYGLEFSPDSSTIYFTDLMANKLYGYQVAAAGNAVSVPLATARDIITLPNIVAALQLGPDGVIYGKLPFENKLISLNGPNNLSSSSVNTSAVQLPNQISTQPDRGNVGLPTFTRIPDACAAQSVDGCAVIAGDVDAQLADQAAEHPNQMRPCDGSDPVGPAIDVCAPLDLPRVTPGSAFHGAKAPASASTSAKTSPVDTAKRRDRRLPPTKAVCAFLGGRFDDHWPDGNDGVAGFRGVMCHWRHLARIRLNAGGLSSRDRGAIRPVG